MREKQFFRFTLLLILITALGGFALWGFYESKVRKQQVHIETLKDYMDRTAVACRIKPAAACISEAEFTEQWAKSVLEGMKAERARDQVVPWVIGIPLTVLIAFYLVRWGITGRLRPLWPLRSD